MKKLTLTLFMAAAMLASCNDSSEREPQAGEPGYISTNGEGVDTEGMVIDRTSNSPEADTAVAPVSEGATEAQMRARKAVNEERERTTYWMLEADRTVTPEAESVKGTLEDMDKKFFRIEADIKNAETGTYNPKGQLSRDAQEKLNEAREKVADAREKLKKAEQKQKANQLDDAAEKIKDANEKLGEAQEKYMDAIEIETGVDMDND